MRRMLCRCLVPGAALALALAPFGAFADLTKFEAETASIGADYAVTNDGTATYLAIQSTGAGEVPGTAARVATFTVTFPAAGTYDLFMRVRVGPGGANDDSFFYANSFGPKSPTDPLDWIRVNSLLTGGFTNPGDVVGGSGTAGTGVWKWVNLSEFANGSSEAGVNFVVTNGGLTQTFQIGAREDGFDIDALVFGTSTLNYTVTNLDAGTDGAAVVIVDGAAGVNWNDVRQRIEGFGASSAWRSTWNATSADRYFSTNTGLGLSLLRTRIAPGATTVENSIMQLARDRGARVWSTPWSPQVSFKTVNANGVTNVNGGSFAGNPANYAAYASQLAHYVVNMKNTYGVTLYALSIQNEPDFITTNYESCGWTAQQIHDFVPYLSSALAASNVAGTRIVLPESESWSGNTGLYTTTLNDPNVAPLVSVVANHNYVPNNNAGDQTVPAALNTSGKSLWETEVSTFDTFNSGITNGIYWARRIHLFLTAAQLNAWHYWWLSADTDNSGLGSGADVITKRGYVVGQFSRFVRPDYFRIGAASTLGAALVSAFKDPTSSKFAIVAINPSGNAINETITFTNFGTVSSVAPWITSATQSIASQSAVGVTNGSFKYLLPAMSVVTFVGQSVANTAPVFSGAADQTINAGAVLVVTNTAVDLEAPPQTLTFGLLAGPASAVLDPASGVLTWRPLIAEAGSTNLFRVIVSDNGTPNLSATNSFNVTVNPLNPVTLDSTVLSDGVLDLVAHGDAGPDYVLWSSSNLLNWELLFATNSPAMPVDFTVTNGGEAQRFFRIQLGP